ncbi:RluA family pseudouridine synthase [Magnetospira sp. QH-2]|uniref:RluA family pseudouridine synthase n=1 Tax=Magnetospira sp. (strain QH-2) TaxID=1288970 RepID=UPI0003E81321|nr:RluA family pseudouridine synthase [Magnetospira sp. QH-2]CCQ75045.1 Ribosomal large subunit pseudouridine synthase D [Magnetospira sp. QH-2]
MSNEPTTYTVEVPDHKSGERLDRFLAEALPELSRSRLKALIESAAVVKNDAPVSAPSAKIRVGETYEVRVPAAVTAEPQPQAMDLTVVFEDEHLIVLDKPPGLVVHPAAGNLDGTLVNALLAHCGDSLTGIGGVQRPGIVHRIDKDTSGLMVAAKTEASHAGLSAQFAAHSLERAYQAVVWGIPSPRDGKITGNIGRSPRNRKKMAVVARGGKEALTHYHVVRPLGLWASLVECRLETGRTHQIRVHMTEFGHSLIGDPLYGRSPRRLPSTLAEAQKTLGRQALHAFLIGFRHPISGDNLRFESPIPNDINSLICTLEEIH